MDKFFVFGNPLLEEDSIPLKILPDLEKVFPKKEFIEFDPNGRLEKLGRNPGIIDTVKGLEEVTIITKIQAIQQPKALSMHDFDLGFNLKLLKKAGMIDSVLIIGVPDKITERRALEQVCVKINEIDKNKN